MQKYRYLPFFPSLLFFVCGCANVSTLQTARALPGGVFRMEVGGGYFDNSAVDAALATSSSTSNNIRFPYLEFGGRVGIEGHVELGGKLTFPGFLGADGKYQFLDHGPFAMAAGLGLSYLGIHASSTSTGSQFGASFFDFLFPLYMSYDFSPVFTVYTSPKLLYRVVSKNSYSNPMYGGGTVGIKIGSDWGLFFEGSYMKNTGSGQTDSFSQVNGALFFGSGSETSVASSEKAHSN